MAVLVGVGVLVAVGDGVLVAVAVGGTGVLVGVLVGGTGVLVGVAVGVLVGGIGVAVGDGVLVGVGVGTNAIPKFWVVDDVTGSWRDDGVVAAYPVGTVSVIVYCPVTTFTNA